MKKLTIFMVFIVLILSIVLFSNNLYVFKNIGLMSKDYTWTDELKIPLSDKEDIVFIENAEYYTVESGKLEDINLKIIGNNEDLKNSLSTRVKIINTNPIILKDTLNPNFIYFYNTYLKLWCKTDTDNLNTLLNSKIFYAKNIRGTVVISKPLSWELFYDLKSNGDLFVTYKINGKIDENSNVTLIDETFKFSNTQPAYNRDTYSKSMALENVSYVPTIKNESAIINLGEVKPFNGEFSKVVKLGTIRNFEDINYLNLNFYSGSFENKYLNIIREFKNSKDNGVGVPLIAGNIHIYTKKDNKEFIQKVSALPKTNENENAEIILGQSWSSTASLRITNETRTKSYIDKTFKLDIKSSGKTKITINGSAMKLISVKGNYTEKIESADKISFYLDGNQELIITIRSNLQ